ncbi:HSP20-like chaperones superfamily protein [Euphorbia peplus]|nr:HSP20-like chaperones superfamily protein [Euphorbia peplus]
MAEKLAPEKRHCFVHNDFEWDEALEEVNMYINLPPNVRPKHAFLLQNSIQRCRNRHQRQPSLSQS